MKRPMPDWRVDGQQTAYRVETAEVGRHRLVVQDIAADGAWPEEIRWEVFGAGQASLASGRAEGFDEARQAAEAAWRKLSDP